MELTFLALVTATAMGIRLLLTAPRPVPVRIRRQSADVRLPIADRDEAD